ncbi:hypothetical protein [Streptomyces sp. 8L]|uniref:hypothetical protein n=1 Tax=Streptomyces sp. 8L TaxID=2877242 RepID=UPI0027E00FBF|nr:hypothetical protein [Streptomyces sp. 8L]
MANTQSGVTFCLSLLHRLSSGEFDVDDAPFARIDRTVDQLEEATEARDAAARKVIAALEPIEAATAATASDAKQRWADDHATLLAIAGGAKLYEYLLTGRMSVTAASGPRIPHTTLQRREEAGLVVRDTGHPVTPGSRSPSPTPDALR